ncbi:methionine synthase, vitamin-B12 independent, partial [Aspergillus ellipticus CBS 707.79]
MAPPFRAEHIGSLIRPDELLAARRTAGLANSYTKATVPEDLERLTQQAIAKLVDQELAHNVRPITTGEYERPIFYAGFFEGLQGLQMTQVPVPESYRNGLPTLRALAKLGITTRDCSVAVGKIQYVHSPYLADWEYLRSLVPREQWHECKLSMPPITWQHQHLRAGMAFTTSSPYTTDKEYFADLAAAFAKEFRTLYDAGLRSIQIDDPAMTFFVTDEMWAGCLADGIDPDELLDLYIWAHNQTLKDRPADLHIGVHLCRGNMPGSTHILSGSYERIAWRMFTGLDYDTFYLEYDSERAGDFQPLRHLPVGKNVVLGVVSTKSAELETLDELEARVYEAADVIAQGQGRSRQEVLDTTLGVSPQCGFASVDKGRGIGMTEERMWEKLQLMQRLAERVWKT